MSFGVLTSDTLDTSPISPMLDKSCLYMQSWPLCLHLVLLIWWPSYIAHGPICCHHQTKWMRLSRCKCFSGSSAISTHFKCWVNGNSRMVTSSTWRLTPWRYFIAKFGFFWSLKVNMYPAEPKPLAPSEAKMRKSQCDHRGGRMDKAVWKGWPLNICAWLHVSIFIFC